MIMLCWISGHTRHDGIRNECGKEKVGVTPIVENILFPLVFSFEFFSWLWILSEFKVLDCYSLCFEGGNSLLRGNPIFVLEFGLKIINFIFMIQCVHFLSLNRRPRKTISEIVKKNLEVNDLSIDMIHCRTLWGHLIHVANPPAG